MLALLAQLSNGRRSSHGSIQVIARSRSRRLAATRRPSLRNQGFRRAPSRKSSSPRRSAKPRCRTCRSRSARRLPTRSARAAPTNIVDLARNVAGLAIADLGPGQSQVAIRGISAGQVIRDQPGVKEQVGIYLDESPISVALFTPDLDLFDLDRFEVLRGPQGTLFGAGLDAPARCATSPRSRTLGDIRTARARSTVQRRSGGEFGGDIKGGGQYAAGRNGGAARRRLLRRLPGFIDAIQPDGSVKKDVNGGDSTGGRVALLFQPNENSAITPRIVYQKLETDGYPRVDFYNILGNPFTTDAAAGRPRRATSSSRRFARASTTSSRSRDLKIDYDFGPVEPDLDQLLHGSPGDRCCAMPASSPAASPSTSAARTTRCASTRRSTTHEPEGFSQELRLASTGDGSVRVAGRRVLSGRGPRVRADPADAGLRRLPAPVGDADRRRLNAPPDTPFFSRPHLRAASNTRCSAKPPITSTTMGARPAACATTTSRKTAC